MKSKLVKLALASAVAFSVMASSTLAVACPNGWSGNPCKPYKTRVPSDKAPRQGATERQKKEDYLKDTLEPSPYKEVPNGPNTSGPGIKCVADKKGNKDCMSLPTAK